jgi:predicted porin
MKKALFSASALVAASALTSGAVYAAGHNEVSISGNAVSGFFYIDSDRPNTGDTSVKFLGEIHFQAEAHLDNGLIAGAHVELEAQTQSDQIDEHYVFIKGGFGRLVLGADDGAANTMHYGLVSPVTGNGVDSPNFLNFSLPVRTQTGTNAGFSGDANKISYYTPRIFGLQFGTSYAPSAMEKGGGKNSGGANVFSTDNQDVDSLFSIGANFSHEFSDHFMLHLSGGFETGSGNTSRDDPELWNLGARASMSDFTVSAAFLDRSDAAANSVDDSVWGISGTYDIGDWTIGIGYVHAKRDGGDVGSGVSASDVGTDVNPVGASFGRDNRLRHVQVGGSYDLSNGIEVGAGFDWYDVDNRSRYNTASSGTPAIST